MTADQHNALTFIQQGTAILHDSLREVQSTEDARALQALAESLALNLSAVSDLAGQRVNQEEEPRHV